MSRMERVHAALYVDLICVLAASGALFLSQFLGSEKFWEHFTLAYLGALVVYTWHLFALLIVHDVKPRRYQSYDGGAHAPRRRRVRRHDSSSHCSTRRAARGPATSCRSTSGRTCSRG